MSFRDSNAWGFVDPRWIFECACSNEAQRKEDRDAWKKIFELMQECSTYSQFKLKFEILGYDEKYLYSKAIFDELKKLDNKYFKYMRETHK